MTVYHSVVFKAKDGTAAAALDACGRALKTLVSIDGVESVKFGETFTTDRARGYTHHLLVAMRDRETLGRYAAHPDHVSIVSTHIKHVFDTATLIALDFED